MTRGTARTVGWVATAASLVLVLLVQWVNDDWFPPEISLSQFGLGPNGWLFSAFMLSIAVASLAWYRVGPPDRITLTLLAVGSLGAVTAAAVPTQAGGLQESWNAVVHMIGSVLLVAVLPFGLCRLVWTRSTLWRVVAVVLLVVSAAALVLLLLAAFGWDSAGLGPQRSWAWWQAVTVVSELSMLVWAAVARGGRQVPSHP